MSKEYPQTKHEVSTPPPLGELEGALIINIGSPEAPTKEAVKKYLKEFLNDPKVMDMPPILRKLLVNGIIVPFRAKKSAGRYAQMWTENGSPLTYHLKNLDHKLKQKLDGEMQVYSAVSYGEPSLKIAFENIKKDGITNLNVLPLYPHYAQSTTESAIADVEALAKSIPSLKLKVIDSFYDHKGFIDSVLHQAKHFTISDYDHILFSYHSLPLKQIEKVKAKKKGKSYDYAIACHETSELLAQALGLSPNDYSSAFQSRFSKRWLGPYTNEVLKELIVQKKKKVLVFTPSFVADCLETTIEIGIEYRDEFLAMGGETLDLVPCVNDSEDWVNSIIEIIK